MDAINKAKPASTKGIYLKKVSVSSTMGAGVRIDQAASTAGGSSNRTEQLDQALEPSRRRDGGWGLSKTVEWRLRWPGSSRRGLIERERISLPKPTQMAHQGQVFPGEHGSWTRGRYSNKEKDLESES